MLTSLIASLVDFSRRFAIGVVLVCLLGSLGMGFYVVRHLSMNTDINQLLADDLDWRKREKELEAAFPQKVDTLVAVIDAADATSADRAAEALAAKLTLMPQLFTSVARPDALPFFRENGLLFLSKEELGDRLDQIAQAQPLLGAMVSDPSLRGLFSTLGLMMQGVQAGAVPSAQVTAPLQAIDASVKAALAGQTVPLDWQKMMPGAGGNENSLRETRRFIVLKPVLDYAALQSGEAATHAVRQAVAELNLTPEQGVRVRLTGSVALNDQEFASVSQGMGTALWISGLAVLGLLFLAMRSARIIFPIAATLIVGLIASSFFAALAVGALNMISVAFAVMFIGIAVDFGIQFGVRYRDQRQREADLAHALRRTATMIAAPLALAAGSTALGFFSFMPTAYRGVSELGLIAGASMLIAFALNLTLLPALLSLAKPPAEGEAIGLAALAPLNAFLQSHRRVLGAVMAVVALIALIGATRVRFDFDPLDLKDPKTESVSTMFEAMQDPDSDAYAAQILSPSPQQARDIAADLERLPQVDHVMTLESFIPDDQEKKLAMIGDTAALLAPTLALSRLTPPGESDVVASVRKMAAALHQASDTLPAARALADDLDNVAEKASPDLLARLSQALVAPLQEKMAETGGLMSPHPVTLADIPEVLRRDWVTADGKWLVEAFPKRAADGNPRDSAILKAFIDAVREVAPDVAGTPVSIRESGATIVDAFIRAGIYGIVAISLLLFAVLKRGRDVLLTLAPLFLAGALTLATIAVLGMPLNYANIIALPLLLSLGVSYSVYFVTFGRTGSRDFLQSSMARAVLFSAATVLVAFVSLCFSSHPGTRSMGELLTIALLYSLVCTFLGLPILITSDTILTTSDTRDPSLPSLH